MKYLPPRPAPTKIKNRHTYYKYFTTDEAPTATPCSYQNLNRHTYYIIMTSSV